MLSDDKLLAQFKKHKSDSQGAMNGQHNAAREDHAFVAGDTMFYKASVMDKGVRRNVVFNKVKPYVDAVNGTMIQIRRKPQYQARLQDNIKQQEYSAYQNNISDYARFNGNFDQLESQQDREMLITGYGALDTGISYEKNPDGEVVGEVCRYDDINWDAMAKETNNLDARYVWREKPFSKEEAKLRFEDADVEEMEAYEGDRGQKEYNPGGGEYNIVRWGQREETDLVQVNYYQWWSLEPYYRAENPAAMIEDELMRQQFLALLVEIKKVRYEASSEEDREDLFEIDPMGQYLSMTPEQYNDVKALCREFGLPFKGIKQRRKCYYTALLSGEQVLRKFKSPDQQGFTIKFKTANYDPNNRMWYGMVRSLKTPAEYANKALTEILFTIASNSKGGVMYEDDAVEDPAKFEQQWAVSKAAIKVNAGALSAGKIQPKAQASLPTGYENVYAISDGAMSEVSGISKEFLGTATNKQVAALLESQRINQVLATLAVYFDAISLYQIEHARMMVTFMRMLAESSMGRLIRILGQDGAVKYEELSASRMADEYDVDIGEAPTTPAQKAQTTEIMMGFADKVAVMGTNIYSTVVNYLPISQADKQTLMKALTPDPQTVQAQQQQAAKKSAMEDELNRVIAEGTIAKSKRDIAEAQVKLATLPKVKADTDNTLADTAKTLEEAKRTHVETHIMQTSPAPQVTV